MQPHQLAYFVAVAETGSFTRGAQRAQVVQSAVSAAITQLERQLGATLFERLYHRVVLTAAGEALLPRAREALAALDAARDAVQSADGELVGVVRLGTLSYTGRWGLVEVLRDFARAHPRVAVHLRQTISGSATSLEEVRAGALDLALVGSPGREAPDLMLTEIASEEMVLACAADHPLAAEPVVAIADLAGQPFVDYPSGWGNRAVVDLAFANAGVDRTIRAEVTDFGLARALVRENLGVTIIPRDAADDSIVTVPLRERPIWTVKLARPTGRRETAAAVRLAERILASAAT